MEYKMKLLFDSETTERLECTAMEVTSAKNVIGYG